MLGELGGLVGKKGEFVYNLMIRNRKITIAKQRVEGILKEKEKIYAEKQLLDQRYEKMLEKEEVEISHEQDMGRVYEAI